MLGGLTLLVVDDEVDAREAIVSLLEGYGAQVHSAASVAEAMVALEAELPDVLITDLGMPGEDGFELIRRVRLLPNAGGSLPSLAVSAYAADEHRERAIRNGFQKHLEKPVAPDELVTTVARLGGRVQALSPD
jgi:CheY-like chemotaxis protein